MKTLQKLLEGILSSPEQDVADEVELRTNIKDDLSWVQKIKKSDALYSEVGLYYALESMWLASNKGILNPSQLAVLLCMSTYGQCPWYCYNQDKSDDWTEWKYDARTDFSYKAEEELTRALKNYINNPNDYRWRMTGSNSLFYMFFPYDFVQSISRRLTREPKVIKYKEKYEEVLKKYYSSK